MFDKLIAGQITRGIMWALAALAIEYGIKVKDTSWVEPLSLAAAGVLVAIGSLLWTRIRARKLLMTEAPAVEPSLMNLDGAGGNLSQTPPAACILLFLLPMLLLGGCGISNGHQPMMNLLDESVKILPEMETGLTETAGSVTAKADMDQDKLDKALVLTIERIAKTTYTDDKARQTEILAEFNKYSLSCAAINTNRVNGSERKRLMQQRIDQLRQALVGMASIEIQRGLVNETQESLIQKAATSDLLKIVLGSKSVPAATATTVPASVIEALGKETVKP